MANYEEEKPNAEIKEGGEKDDLSRRQFISDMAIKAAVAALFGAVAFDSVMARAMDRVNEVQAARRIGGSAAEKLAGVVPLNECAPGTYNQCQGTSYSCGTNGCYVFGCTIRNFDCPYNFTCGTYGTSCFNCGANDFTCDENFTCQPGHVNCTPSPYQCPLHYYK